MSSFDGFIEGFSDVAVDRFEGRLLKARHLFLSHCHKDHMHGLSSDPLRRALESGSSLYCSRLSASLLAAWPEYRNLSKLVRPLDLNQRLSLDDGLTVTLLPANHCAGSVMFLFEDDERRVLYTGDFRLQRQQLQRMAALHDPSGRPLPLSLLYTDATFCMADRRDLPERCVSEQHVVRLAQEFLARGTDHRVNIVCKCRFGYEHLFKRLCTATGQRVHVDDEKYEMFSRVPDIGDCMTDRRGESRLHSCWQRGPCGSRLANLGPVRTILVSTMYFFLKQDQDCMVCDLGGEEYRVLYSFHASLRETQELVRYLRPQRVVPFAIPKSSTSEEVEALLSTCVDDEAESDELDRHVSTVLAPCNGQRDAAADWTPLAPLLTPSSSTAGRPRKRRRRSGGCATAPPAAVPDEPPPSAERWRQQRGDTSERGGRHQGSPAAVVDCRPPWQFPFDSD